MPCYILMVVCCYSIITYAVLYSYSSALLFNYSYSSVMVFNYQLCHVTFLWSVLLFMATTAYQKVPPVRVAKAAQCHVLRASDDLAPLAC